MNHDRDRLRVEALQDAKRLLRQARAAIAAAASDEPNTSRRNELSTLNEHVAVAQVEAERLLP
jgi:hypothetical protein